MAPALIIFLVILGAGGLVVCAFAMMRFWGGDDAQDTSYLNRSVEQDRYMKEVRDRTWGKLPRYYVQGQQSSRSQLATGGQSVSASNTTYG
ncbi:hypothetical protein C7974DRAFT_408304 [Boeremia exigua]|uniref:uncharacterized protein n=1 Tax=Boeremia exigua TaxID=749465 RepID=UPI001E8E3435|nr:uncharacterized protein C7974DRAFT_408304 [Boeremia exigua]KAH6644637.1 hypothetical protein C7974DRAFT_408304 [Boeremia exigua]